MKSRLGLSILLLMAWIPVIGCGGSGKSTLPAPTTYTIKGTVAGATGAGLVLQNNGGNDLTVSANATSFSFTTPVSGGGVYSVTVLSQPAGANCTVSKGDGQAMANVTNVSVTCSPQFTIGGIVKRLTGPGLILQNNGGDNLAVSANETSFTFATPVAGGSAYSISILMQPVGENCVVANGAGTASANVTNATVVCTQLYAVGGTINGLHGTGLVLEDNGGNNLTVAAEATSFNFTTPLPGGSAYSVTVLSQPASESCIVSNGSGTVSTDIANVNIVCVGEWSWMNGSSSVGLNGGVSGVYGTLGASAPANLPGGREQSGTWKDASGNIWLMGGYGEDTTGTTGLLNDLWKFDPSKSASGEWTWVSGNSVAPLGIPEVAPNGEPGVYGTLGKPAPGNAPGGREQMVTWIDSAGNLWLFGGIGIDSAGLYGYLNDLWEFNPNLGSNGEWAWMGGSTTVPEQEGNSGVYGTLGTPSANNIPGGRYGGYAWTDPSGNFWLFGGNGFDSVGTNAYLNDLWKYTPGANGAAGKWTWIGGLAVAPISPSPFSQSAAPGVYGTLGSQDTANIPGGRSAGVTWTDASGNLWLLGGLGADSVDTTGYLNDLWKYTPGAEGTAGEWTWMSGSNTIGINGGQPGVYGVLGVADAANTPGARFSSATWIDVSGSFWLFGGQGYDWTGASGFLNDLWEYTPSAKNGGRWTWMGGSNVIPPNPAQGVESGEPGVYGTLGTPAATNTPGARIGAMPWVDSSGNLWLFGGQGYDGAGSQGYLNDSWMYQP
ncbi:kelch repeat-containing protein [Acidicapsa ligni]|uniref:kelch repeat-containing protein n=1 Tax=Acidicapsa ligni TaxID=542300 RepID=UPI0021E07624|nr:kelch repeat-containing protein [Acidicapsa ligni]